jgi:hypothetical protein
MPEAPRHAKLKQPATRQKSATRLWVPVMAAATLTGVAAAFAFLPGVSPAPRHATARAASAQAVTAAASSGSDVASYQVTAAIHRVTAALEARSFQRIAQQAAARAAQRAARRKHLAALAAARLAQQQAAQQQAAQSPPPPSPSPSSTPTPTPTPTATSAGGDAASSPLGVCIRNAEEGGSYAWGPGNGGGAYQFQLGTWETYGGAASEYGVAGPAYQDQIFDNAIAAGGASNWTAYDGC